MVELLVVTHTKDTSNIWIDYLWNDVQELRANRSSLNLTIVHEHNIERLTNSQFTSFDAVLYVASTGIVGQLQELAEEYDIRIPSEKPRFLFFGSDLSAGKETNLTDVLNWYKSMWSYKEISGVAVNHQCSKESRFDSVWNKLLCK